MRLKPATAFTGAVLTAGLAVAGCAAQTGGSSTASSATASASPSVTVSTSQPSTATDVATDDTTDDAAVDANTASKSEIEAALTEAGVPDAAKWADEIEKYRPYTAADLEAKLTQELGKSNVDQATLTKILSVLTVG